MTKFHLDMRRVAAVLIGLVFFISGTLKLMDPVGTKLIVTEYFKFFHVGFLAPTAKVAGVVLSIVEAIAGTALIAGVYRRIYAWVASCLVAFFTLVTLVLWIGNPVMDCGCFGEAIHLSHAGSFIKNVVLLALCAFAFLPFRDFGKYRNHRLVAFWLEAATILVVCVYSLLYIPPMDFTPFDLSTRLAAAEEIPGSDVDEYVSTFVYEKNGQQGTFTLDNLPDSTWTFVRTETVQKRNNIVSDNFPELAFRNASGEYCDSMAAKELVMVVSVYDPGKMRAESWKKTSDVLSAASGAGFTPLLLLAAGDGTAPGLLPDGLSEAEKAPLLDNAYYCDYKTLISLNRSNGGAVYFNDGDLIEKWASRSLPSAEKIRDISESDATDLSLTVSTKGRLFFQSFYLYSLIILAFV